MSTILVYLTLLVRPIYSRVIPLQPTALATYSSGSRSLWVLTCPGTFNHTTISQRVQLSDNVLWALMTCTSLCNMGNCNGRFTMFKPLQSDDTEWKFALVQSIHHLVRRRAPSVRPATTTWRARGRHPERSQNENEYIYIKRPCRKCTSQRSFQTSTCDSSAGVSFVGLATTRDS